MNNKILTLGLVIAMALASNCKKDDKNDDDVTLLALLYVADQSSGNCAQVTKSGTTYTATLSPLPKGGCSVAQTRAAALQSFRSFYEKYVQVYTRAGSDCAVTSAAIQVSSNNLTETTASGSATEEAYATSIANKRAFSVASLATEAALSLAASTPSINAATVKVASFDQYILELARSAASSSASCQNRIRELDVSYFDGRGNNTIITSASCKYGTGAVATDRCATLNTEF